MIADRAKLAGLGGCLLRKEWKDRREIKTRDHVITFSSSEIFLVRDSLAEFKYLTFIPN